MGNASGMVEYKNVSVLDAAKARISTIFDKFDRIVISVSSGKDSQVLYHLSLEEARRRGRQVEVFFLDQEAEYQASIDVISEMMTAEGVIPKWYQVPILLTNATSYKQLFLDAWHPGKEWIHPQSPLAITDIDKKYPDRFYKFFEWYERQAEAPTAFCVGLRSKEALTRFRAVTRNPGYQGITWSSKTKNTNAYRFYPLYDWTFGDIWKYIADNKIKYNRIYDLMFLKSGENMSSMRISNLVHEKSYKALVSLQEFEPDTYERVIRRLNGCHSAALYALDNHIYSPKTLPLGYTTWRSYRDYLLASAPIDTKKKERMAKRFAAQGDTEEVCKQQCKQVLIGDWENNVPVNQTKKDRLKKIWWNRL